MWLYNLTLYYIKKSKVIVFISIIKENSFIPDSLISISFLYIVRYISYAIFMSGTRHE